MLLVPQTYVFLRKGFREIEMREREREREREM